MADDSVEFAYRTIRGSILTGKIPPGAVISQVTLARELGISRTPLREALSRLTSEGLLRNDFNHRMRVSELDLDDFDQIYAARLALEPLAVRTTVGNLSEDMRSELSGHVDAMDHAIGSRDMDSFRADHRAFHLGLVRLGGDRITRMLADLWDNSERYRLAYLHYDVNQPGSALDDRLQISQVEHRQMLVAALEGDQESCVATLESHLTRTLLAVFEEAAHLPRPRVAHHVTPPTGTR